MTQDLDFHLIKHISQLKLDLKGKERPMLSLLATLVALACISASFAMIATDDAVYMYPPRFE